MANLSELLKFVPWHGGDPPGPLGPWVFEHLDKTQLVSLAQAALDHTRAVLDAQMKLNARMQEILAATTRTK